eukprot:13200023-Alexandrium_andersonii.AAC.1
MAMGLAHTRWHNSIVALWSDCRPAVVQLLSCNCRSATNSTSTVLPQLRLRAGAERPGDCSRPAKLEKSAAKIVGLRQNPAKVVHGHGAHEQMCESACESSHERWRQRANAGGCGHRECA